MHLYRAGQLQRGRHVVNPVIDARLRLSVAFANHIVTN